MTSPVCYPPGPITKHGAYYLIEGVHPEVRLVAYDQSIVIAMMGGQAIPDRTMPEYVILKDIKGLIPPWQMIDQKGATQDGVTFLDALYDPIEVDATVIVRGRDAKRTRKVIRDLIGSIDAKQTSELSWWTQELGYWWSDIRWFKTAPDPLTGAQQLHQKLSLSLRADNGFWKSFDDVDQFKLDYVDVDDTFSTETGSGLGVDWTIAYSGAGGLIRSDGQQAVITVDPARPVVGDGREVICRRNGYTTSTDDQVVEITLGVTNSWTYPDGAYNDAWARMANTGTPGLDGVRLRVGLNRIRLSYFVNGAETVLREQSLAVQPMPGERFAVVCGYTPGRGRTFKALRNGIEVQGMTTVESGTGSPLGTSYRSTGFALHAAPTTGPVPAMPMSVRGFTAGTHTVSSQSGFLTRENVGDQPRADRYTFFGPGTFSVADGPRSTSFVQFGPLLAGQIMQVQVLNNEVIDLTSSPASPQELVVYEQARQDLASFATANNAAPLLASNASIFGVQPPQGNPYSLLTGRFSKNAYISAKSPGAPVEKQSVAVRIDDGTVDSAVLATGTPLRRYPA